MPCVDGAIDNPLRLFSPAAQEWFVQELGQPTDVQRRAWEVIASGENALVVAPTGSGKTLAAFYFAIDRLWQEKSAVAQGPQGDGAASQKPKKGKGRSKGVRVLYISPLKALGADVERNLRRPLAGLAAKAVAGGMEAATAAGLVTTAQRTGDTTPDQRRKIVSHPPDILITTPESLYLMLTSQVREVLKTVEAVIVDEVHALAGNKRGAHLSLSLERLDALLPRPAQRVGLSATVRPVEEVARFLGGVHPVTVVQAQARPSLDLRVAVPVPDMTAVPAFGGAAFDKARSSGANGAGPRRVPAENAWKSDRALRALMANEAPSVSPDSRVGAATIWPYLESDILDLVLTHRSTIVFVNSRGLCEKLTARLNELYARRYGGRAVTFVDAGYWSAVGSVDTAGPRTAGASGEEQRCSKGDESSAVGQFCPGAHGEALRGFGPTGAYRSDMGSSTELGQGAPEVVAKAHHGSVSKERRREVEEALKSGALPCVVATSSLELGIDMGEVDLVVQVAPPPSVASGLQRVGRANHQVGGKSAGVFLPRTRCEVLDTAVVAEGMEEGRIEATRLVENALDVLAQQTVAAVAMDGLEANEWYGTVRRSACFADLPRSAFGSVLALLAGEYTEGVLAKVPARLSWDRAAGTLTAKPGAQRAAVGAAGTIPDRGMFPVVLPQGDGAKGRKRVGELDEEMVMESRVGDVIALGTSTWKICEITADRVIVEPAPGRSARLPFWHGEAQPRPFEAGKAKGEFLAWAQGILEDEGGPGDGRLSDAAGFCERLGRAGLDDYASGNLAALLQAQQAATGVLPSASTLVMERCEDETGGWRLILHSPFGRAVNEPWALAVAERLKARYGFNPQVMAGDDGILVQWPVGQGGIPGAELFAFTPDEAMGLVRASIAGTALFAARFRECAARALLMPPAAAGKRAPLWLQRLKGGQLLEAARLERNFPIMVEALRECLQDVFDIEAFLGLMNAVQAGKVGFSEARTLVPSPFAAALVFGYVAEHLYEGDLPHAERASSMLSVDPAVLGEVLGAAEVGDLLDPVVVAAVERQLQRTAPGWQRKGIEGVEALLRELGPLSVADLLQRLDFGDDEAPSSGEGESCAAVVDALPTGAAAARGCPSEHEAVVVAWLQELELGHRVFPVALGGADRWAFVSDGRRLAEVTGAEVPPWALAAGPVEEGRAGAAQTLDALARRFAATHGPFEAKTLARHLGVGELLADESLKRLEAAATVVPLRFGGVASWADAGMLQRLRRLSAQAVEQAAAPVKGAALQQLVLRRQGVPCAASQDPLDALAEVIVQFEGAFLPYETWAKVVFSSRVPQWAPGLLQQLLDEGEVIWQARGQGEGKPPLVAFYPTDSPAAPLPLLSRAVEALLEETGEGAELGNERETEGAPAASGGAALRREIARALASMGPMSLPQMTEMVARALPDQEVSARAVTDQLDAMAQEGLLTNSLLSYLAFSGDSSAAVARSTPSRQQPALAAPGARRASSRRGRRAAERQFKADFMARRAAAESFDAAYGGNWALLRPAQADPTLAALDAVEGLLDRYGVVTADVALLAGVPGGLSGLYPVLRSMEEAGEVLRGCFVEGLGPVQFAARETVEQLRRLGEPGEAEAAGCEGGAAAGAAGGTPSLAVLPAEDPAFLYGAVLPWPDGAAVQKRPGALAVLKEGALAAFASPHLKSLALFTASEPAALAAIEALRDCEVARLRREGTLAKAKLVVEAVNGESALEEGNAALLQQAGFVRYPDGMRYYPQLF